MFNKLIRLLICLVLAATPTSAGWFPLADAFAAPISNACSTTSGTVITFTAQGTGGTNANRISVVSINWDDSTAAGTAQLTGMTIGGITMLRAVSNTAGATNSNSEIWYVANPSGTTANIVATFATAVDGVTIEVYSLIGYQSVLATTTGTTSVSQGYNNKQLALAAASRTVNVSTSLSNMANDFSSACGANLWGVHASQALHGNGGTLSSTISPTTSNPKIALVIWTTAPAFGTCSQSQTFLLRTSGLDATHQNAYDAYICGLVTDSLWSKFDVLYILATQNATTALLNLVSTSYNGIANGSPAFTVDRGYTGVDGSSTVYIDTGFNAATAPSPQYTTNLAHVSFWAVNNASSGFPAIGVYNGLGQGTFASPFHSSNVAFFRINSQAVGGVASANSIGHWIANRSGANSSDGYKNGSNVITDGTASFTIQSNNYSALAGNNGGTIAGGPWQQAMISIGSSLSATDALNFYNRTRTFMTAVGVP